MAVEALDVVGRRGVSREAVEEARDALVAAGLVPSVRTVREKLGDTGSLTTIAGHLRAIELERADGPGPALPDALVRGLVDGAAELWRDIAAAADAQVDAIDASAAAKVAAMRLERDEAVARAADARHELGTSRAMVASLERHVGESSARADRLETRVAEAQSAVRAADTEASDRREERAALAHELELSRTREEAERAAFDARLAATAARIDELQAALGAEQTRRAEETRAQGLRADEHAARAAELATSLARSEERLAAAVARAEQSNERAGRTEFAALEATRRHERAMNELVDARRRDLLACHARIEQLSTALAEARSQVPEPLESLPSTEFQPGLALDDDPDNDPVARDSTGDVSR